MPENEQASWFRRASALVPTVLEGFAQRWGYEPDCNEVTPPRMLPRELDELPRGARTLFSHLGEVSWPDVWNGYFLGPDDAVLARVRAGDDVVVAADVDRSVVLVGGDGGGNLFVLDLEDGGVLRVEAPVKVDGRLHGATTRLADGVEPFLEQLLENLRLVAEGGVPPF